MIKKQRGFNLVELMVALAVGALLMTGLVDHFVNFKVSYRLMNAWSRLQEQGRFADFMLHHQIAMAGYAGCKEEGMVKNKLAIKGFYANLAPSKLKQLAAPGSDILVLGECQFYHGRDQFLTTAYFVSRSSGGLYRKILSEADTPSQRLLDDVYNMKIYYGLDEKPANLVKNWQAIKLVDVQLSFYLDHHKNQRRNWNIVAALHERL